MQAAEELSSAQQFELVIAESKQDYDSTKKQIDSFVKGPLTLDRETISANRHEYEATLTNLRATLQRITQKLEQSKRAAKDARKHEFGWDRFNMFSKRHAEATEVMDNERTLKASCNNLQQEVDSSVRRLGQLTQQLEHRCLPPLVMRVAKDEVLKGHPLGVVRTAVGNYSFGFSLSLKDRLRRYKDEEAQNFALAARKLQREAQALGADAVVGVRWLQCDEFEIEEDKDENRTEYRRVQRHKPFEALLCGTAVQRNSQAMLDNVNESSSTLSAGNLFCSTLRDAPYGTVVGETMGIVQGVGVNATWSLTFNMAERAQNLATSEQLAFAEAHQNLLAAAKQLGANAVLGVKPEEPFHRMCVLRGTAVKLVVTNETKARIPFEIEEGMIPPTSLQSPPVGLHVIENLGLVSAVGVRPARWFTWDSPSRTEEEAFHNAVRALTTTARKVGANAVMGVKWMHDNDRFVSQVVGTAVILGRDPNPRLDLELNFKFPAFASTLREPPSGFLISSIVGVAVAASVSPWYSRGNWQSRLSAQGEVLAVRDAVEKIQRAATNMGAHAILGVKIESLSVYNCSRFMCVVRGTAVKLAKQDDVANMLPFNADHMEVSSLQAPPAHLCVSRVIGLVSSVGYRPWRFAFGFRSQKKQDAANEQATFAEAVQGLVRQARQLGANAVMGIKWQHDDDHRSSCLIGTAVVLANRPGASQLISLGSGRPFFATTSRAPPAGLAVADTVGVVSGAGMSVRFSFGAQERADKDRESFDSAYASLQQTALAANCDAVLGMKMESPEPGLVILRGTAVRLTSCHV
jgi:uncharacterized protein YbjQ (UPF0145 family)